MTSPTFNLEHIGDKPYFPGLDGLRAYAAISVVLFHAFLAPVLFGLSPLKHLPFFLEGPDAVSLFFVLSGFLISCLLLEEKKQTGRISLQKFYSRRIARIFPLYYMTLALGLWILPWLLKDYQRSDLTRAHLAMMVTFLSNLTFALGAPMGTLSHLWSIGSEEQFYLVWPFLMKRARRPWPVVLVTIALWIAAMGTVSIMISKEGLSPGLKAAFRFINFAQFQCMGMGAAAALILHRQHPIQRVLLGFPMWILSFALGLFATAFWPVTTPALIGFRNVALALSFAVIVAQVAVGRGRRMLELLPFRFLGRISYGIYMYHPLVIGIAAPLFFRRAPGHPEVEFPWSYVFSVFGGTIALATISYSFVESPILGLARSSRRAIDLRTGATPERPSPDAQNQA